MAAAVTDKTRLVFVANPNNPTGTLVGAEEIERFLNQLPEHVIAVFDEAYYEFLEDAPDTIQYVKEGRNVVVMRTFSKAQGLAGLRIGYGMAPASLAGILQKARQPFNTNELAQMAALASLADTAHIEATVKNNQVGRDLFEKSFAEMLSLIHI